MHRPDGAGPELIVQTNDRMYKGEIYYGERHGFVFGDGTLHGTRECDHRSSGETRISVTIWLIDYNEANFDRLSPSSIFSDSVALSDMALMMMLRR